MSRSSRGRRSFWKRLRHRRDFWRLVSTASLWVGTVVAVWVVLTQIIK